MVNLTFCSAKDCKDFAWCLDLCFKHFMRLKRSDGFTSLFILKANECSHDGCTNKKVGKGLCWKHYRRALRSHYRRVTYACLMFHSLPYWLLYLKSNPWPDDNYDDFDKPRKRRHKAVARPISPNAKRCSLDGCENPMNARGLCGRHYRAAERSGTLPPRAVKPSVCSVEGCSRAQKTKGLCQMHYKRFWKRGTTELVQIAGRKGYRAHGMTGTPTYNSWQSMIQRCTNPKAKGYANYGGRDIKVSWRWLHSFTNFYADMGERPKGKTIHRIDLDGDYEPGNCKWATTQEQNRRRRLHNTNTSGYRGVHYYRGAWTACIGPGNETLYLGRFKTKEEAARTYNQAAIVHFGAEAMLNAV